MLANLLRTMTRRLPPNTLISRPVLPKQVDHVFEILDVSPW